MADSRLPEDRLPDKAVLVRTTDVFDRDSVPAGLLRAHRVADGVWGRLVVHSGSIRFAFEDDPEGAVVVEAGDGVVVPPGRLHHVEFVAVEQEDASSFAVEFYRLAERR